MPIMRGDTMLVALYAVAEVGKMPMLAKPTPNTAPTARRSLKAQTQAACTYARENSMPPTFMELSIVWMGIEEKNAPVGPHKAKTTSSHCDSGTCVLTPSRDTSCDTRTRDAN